MIPGTEPIVKRCIHTSADFDYAKNLVFSEHAVEKALSAIRNGASIVTDTQMGKSGINKKKLAQYGGKVHCFMSDEDVAVWAKEHQTTRAVASMEKAAALQEPLIFAIGNAPTALIRRLRADQEGTDSSGACDRSSGWICQCGAVERTDPDIGGDAVYRGTGAERRKQYCGMYLQCIALYAGGMRK